MVALGGIRLSHDVRGLVDSNIVQQLVGNLHCYNRQLSKHTNEHKNNRITKDMLCMQLFHFVSCRRDAVLACCWWWRRWCCWRWWWCRCWFWYVVLYGSLFRVCFVCFVSFFCVCGGSSQFKHLRAARRQIPAPLYSKSKLCYGIPTFDYMLVHHTHPQQKQ